MIISIIFSLPARTRFLLSSLTSSNASPHYCSCVRDKPFRLWAKFQMGLVNQDKGVIAGERMILEISKPEVWRSTKITRQIQNEQEQKIIEVSDIKYGRDNIVSVNGTCRIESYDINDTELIYFQADKWFRKLPTVVPVISPCPNLPLFGNFTTLSMINMKKQISHI